MRIFLREGTRIRVPGGVLYEISGSPIGEGGGSIIYPARRHLPDGEEGYSESPLLYALKECYPLSERFSFTRDSAGEVVPEEDSREARRYLKRVKEMQRAENAVTGEIYSQGFRLTPVIESYQEVELSKGAGQPFQKVKNSIAVMESLAGKGTSLKKCLAEQKHLPAQETFRIIEQVLYALREVHQAGYLHLDLQDGNIFLKGTLADGSGMISLIDLGSSRKRMADGSCAAVADGVLYATPGFSAPEMRAGNDGTLKLGPQADLYSIGCLMLLLLTGRRFSSWELLMNKTGRYIPRFFLRKTRCPRHMTERMEQILAKALKEEPKDRYADTEEMLEDVTAFLEMLAPYRAPLSGVGYDAFICYRHGPLDTPAARTLRDVLERCRGIERVFVDEGELSSCADLGERIRDALENSRWLVLVCSGQTRESSWVDDEIRTFLRYHDPSHILAVITEGEPEEIWPEALVRQGLSGRQILAADARAADKRRVLRKIRGDVKLKIAAPILDTTFDALKQRRKVYEIKRAFVLVSIVFLAAASFLGYAAVTTRKIADQALKTADEHRASLKNQAVYMAELARQSCAAHDHMAALRQALQGYDLVAGEDVFIPGLFPTLAESLGLYVLPLHARETVTAQGIFRWESDVDQQAFFLDEKGEHLFTAGDDCMYIWDTETFQCVKKITAPWQIGQFGEDFLIEQRKQYLFILDGGLLVCSDYERGTCVWEHQFEERTITGTAVSEDGDKVAVTTDQTLYILDAADGQIIRSSVFAKEPLAGWSQTRPVWSPDGGQVAFTGDRIVLYDIEKDAYTDGTAFQEDPGADLTEVQCRFTRDGRLLALSESGADTLFTGVTRKYYSEKIRFAARLYDPDGKSLLWSREREEMTVDAKVSVQELTYGGRAALLLVYGKTCEYLDLDTGEVLDAYGTEAPVIQAWCGEGTENFVLENGDLLRHREGEDRLRGYGYFTGGLTGYQGRGTAHYIRQTGETSPGSRAVIKYQENVSDPRYERCAYTDLQHLPKGVRYPQAQPLREGEEAVSGDGRYTACLKGTAVEVEDTADKEVSRLKLTDVPESLFWMQGTDGSAKLLIGYADRIHLYDAGTESLSGPVRLDEDMWDAAWLYIDGETVAYVGPYYGYMVHVSGETCGILCGMIGLAAYEPEEDALYFTSQIFSMDRLNEGAYIDEMEIGKIRRYSKAEIIEMAREKQE